MEEQESLRNRFGTVRARSIAEARTKRSSGADIGNYIGVQIVSTSHTEWHKLHKGGASAVRG
jgi:hypothetical protein